MGYNGSGRDPAQLEEWVKADFETDSQDKTEEESSEEEKNEDDPEDEKKKSKKPKAAENTEQNPAKIHDNISEKKLYEGLFELADNWTPNISAEEIVGFFKTLEYQMQYKIIKALISPDKF